MRAQLARLDLLMRVGHALAQRADSAAKGLPGLARRVLLTISIIIFERATVAVCMAIEVHNRLMAALEHGTTYPVCTPQVSEHAPEPEPEALDVAERLERPRPEPNERQYYSQAFLERPVDELIDIICQKLGLDPADLADVEADAGDAAIARLVDAAFAVLTKRAKCIDRRTNGPPPALPDPAGHLADLVPVGASP